MTKVINGHKYSTDTAKNLGYDSHSNASDFSWWCETLHRTKAGLFFIHGEGGPMSRYASHSGDNSWGYGEEIIPMSEDAAKEWAEEHLSGDEYEAAFGRINEDCTSVSALIPDSLLEKLDAVRGKTSRSDMIIKALDAMLK